MGNYLTSGKVSSARWWWAEESTVGFVTLNVYNICCSDVVVIFDDIGGDSISDNICGDNITS